MGGDKQNQLDELVSFPSALDILPNNKSNIVVKWLIDQIEFLNIKAPKSKRPYLVSDNINIETTWLLWFIWFNAADVRRFFFREYFYEQC